MTRRKTVVTVTLDCAALAWATRHIQTEQEWANWGRTFVEALATNKSGLNAFADDLIAGVHAYRETKAEEMRILRGKSSSVTDVPEQSNVTEHSPTSSLVLSSLDKELKGAFDEARKKYPGKKRGLDVEWKHFLSKHGKRKAEIVPLILPGIARYCRHLAANKTEAKYIKHFQGWVSEERWTEEYPEWNTQKQEEVAQAGMTEEQRLREWRRKNVI